MSAAGPSPRPPGRPKDAAAPSGGSELVELGGMYFRAHLPRGEGAPRRRGVLMSAAGQSQGARPPWGEGAQRHRGVSS